MNPSWHHSADERTDSIPGRSCTWKCPHRLMQSQALLISRVCHNSSKLPIKLNHCSGPQLPSRQHAALLSRECWRCQAHTTSRQLQASHNHRQTSGHSQHDHTQTKVSKPENPSSTVTSYFFSFFTNLYTEFVLYVFSFLVT